MNKDEMQTLIDFLTHLEFCLHQLGNYQESPDPGPVMLTHCGKYHLAHNTRLEVAEMKRRLTGMLPTLPDLGEF
jgi:hypothetical protein